MIRRVATMFAWAWAAIATCWLAGCAGQTPAPTSPSEVRFEFVRVCMGVRTTITLFAPNEEAASDAAAAAFARIGVLDDVLSDYRPRSEAMRLCAAVASDSGIGHPILVSDDLFQMLATCERISRATDGAFDATIGPAVRLWRETRQTGVLPSEAALRTTREAIGWQYLRLDEHARTAALLRPGMRLDFGGIGKGHAAECAVRTLREHGYPRCMVALAGDIATGDPPWGEHGWRIRIDGLRRDGQEDATLLLAGGAVSTAGDEEQFVEIGGVRYSHIIDPRTLLGMTQRRHVTVVAIGPGCGARADGLDTPLCLLGAQKARTVLADFPRTAAILTETDGRIVVVDPDGILPRAGLHWR